MIPQFVPYWGEKETSAVSDILTNSDYLNEHKTVREFERSFAEFVGAKHCVAVTSGTMALYCAIHAASNMDAVRIPSHDGIFAFNALLAAGRTPAVSDVDHMGLLRGTDGPSITVHANGRISDSVKNIEDCAQAVHHHTKNKISTYSFASTKHITTGGQGGAVCCDDQETFDKLTRLKDHGRNDRQMLRPMSDNYDRWGVNFKLTEIQAAFGLVQLQDLKRRMRRFGEIYAIYSDGLKGVVDFDDAIPSWYVDVFTPKAGEIRDKLKKKDIHCRSYPKPLHMQDVASGYIGDSKFPNAESRYKTGLYLPSSTNLGDEDIKRVTNEVIHAVSEL